MPRIARVVAVGFPHHITQRGNYGQSVFLDDSDKERYLRWIQEYSKKYDLSILTYCIMTNHVHFIVIPNREDSMAKTFNTAHMRYSQYFNKKRGVIGHLWQGRFYSYVMDEAHLKLAARYIERNPVRAMLVKKPWEWKWSSASCHIVENSTKSIIDLKDIFGLMEMEMDQKNWEVYISEEEERKNIDIIDNHLINGYPLAEYSFIKKIEQKLNRILIALPRGRPCKKKKK